MWSVFFVFLSYLDRNFVKGEFLTYSLDGGKEAKAMFLMLNSTFCAKMSVIGENYLYQVSDGVEEVSSVRDPAGKLVDCSVTVNQMQVKSFMHICRLGLKDQTTKLENFETSFAHLADAKANCQEFQRKTERKRVIKNMNARPIQDQKDEDKVLSRSKRGFTYPGTLWCGAGNIADDVNQLGVFAETDSCCRVHDHCPHVIHAFSSKYGYTNFKWLSISHCDCDNAMKDCLRKVNDSSSRVVGQAFFNVMEVPCFEFMYEEQCVERHWYGMCKKYEKMPVAVAKESIPYDFGGIDVIDVLTLAPPQQKESNKSGLEQDGPEGPTEPPVSGSQTTGPEEPSLSNVVTAAEDFIKVLATVSTSQSSTTEAAKGEAESSEKKKKKKNSEKNKNKKKKTKGRGRKRKQRVESISKAEEAAPGTPTSSKAEEVDNKSNFVDEPSKVVQFNRNVNCMIDLGGKEEPSNDVMKDQPMTDEENASITTSIYPTSPVKKELKLDTQAHTENKQTELLSVTISIPTTMQQKRLRPRQGRKNRNHISPTFPPEQATTHNAVDQELPVKTTDTSVVQSSTPTVPSEQPEQQRLGPTTIHARAPIVAPLKRKRHRSKERKNRNKRRRITSSSPIEEAAAQHSTKDEFRTIIGSPTPTTVKTATDLDSHRPENDSDMSPLTTSTRATTTASTSTAATIATTRATTTSAASSTTTAATSTLNAHQNKRQRSKEREGRKRRKKLVLPLLADTTSPQSASEETMSVLSATECPAVLTVPPTSTMGLVAVENDGKRGRLTATAGTLVLTAGGHGSREGERKKRRKKNSPAVFNVGVTPHNDNETDPRTKTTARLRLQTMPSEDAEIEELKDGIEQVLYTAQPSTPSMSLIQSILQKAEEQLGWKRRRKTRLSNKQP
ncbi:uncharacterized protein proca1 [Osmerus eperlanus]|uniref:uncharacterized protein proca1 n=1 Tax=Osmerus eperlanus TaxID=29151 RepID=UPI002E0E9C88